MARHPARRALARRSSELGEPVQKAYTIDAGDAPAGARPVDLAPTPKPTAEPSEAELSQFYNQTGALAPPLEPYGLQRLYEKSSTLRPCVTAYKTNIDGFGYQLRPVVDLDAPDADEKISDCISAARQRRGDRTPPSPADVAAAREVIKREMRVERDRIDRFFRYAFPDMSLVEARLETREDLEVTGSGYWEVLRANHTGPIRGFSRVGTRSMRLRTVEPSYRDVPTAQKYSLIDYEIVDVARRFRSFVQANFGIPSVFFKEFGDTRTMSSRTGRYFDTLDQLREVEGLEARPATEVLHFKIYSGTTPYGVPRWVGATLAVFGERSSSEVNARYFHNKAIPPMAILVAGGKLAKGAADGIRNHLREKIVGMENFWNVLVIEATSDASGSVDSPSRVRIELRPLYHDQPQDALFQTYEANCDKKVARQFRLPEIVRGASMEVNRAQAEAALDFVEEQVFQPEREAFDEIMNRRIFADMQVRFWTFTSNSAPVKDAERAVDLVAKLVAGSILTPGEAREIASEALKRDLKPIDEPWTRQPIALTLAGVTSDAARPAEDTTQTVQRVQQALTALDAYKSLVGGNGRPLVIKVPKETIDDWFEPEAA